MLSAWGSLLCTRTEQIAVWNLNVTRFLRIFQYQVVIFVAGVRMYSFFTDTLILPEINGPTEGLMLIYLAHIFTAIVGIFFINYLISLSHALRKGFNNF